MRILVFGTSITFGAWDRKGGWVERLKNFFIKKFLSDKNFRYLVYNLGISGDTTEDLLERFEFEAKQRLKEGEETIVIFEIGGNDSQFIHSQNSLRILPEKFRQNIQNLINLAKKFSSKIIFIGHSPVDETKTTPIPWNRDKSYKNENVSKYNEIIKSVCQENNVYFIEIFEKLSKLGYQNLLEDGLHSNSKGHQKIFETIKDFLIKNKII